MASTSVVWYLFSLQSYLFSGTSCTHDPARLALRDSRCLCTRHGMKKAVQKAAHSLCIA